ncbi:hypothetical protein NMY22_g13995 [Coprinellus aureogranulatus]|nr:hypothetical protein NMY22_g13995 [Coprinellus aureogranulatus]
MSAPCRLTLRYHAATHLLLLSRLSLEVLWERRVFFWTASLFLSSPSAPSLTSSAAEALLTAPGSVHETQTALIDGRLYKVYKNLWPSLREFWLAAVLQYAGDTYIVYEDRRLTYGDVHRQAMRVADLMRRTYSIQMGDRVGICSRNTPEYLIIFWACHLVGAVAVLANAWLPVDPLRHCLSYTSCKLVFVDSERAEVLSPLASSSVSSSNAPSTMVHFIVIDTPTSRWSGIFPLQGALASYTRLLDIEALRRQTPIHPEDNATIIFTSGTTGLPKGVLSTQRQFLTNVLNVLVGGFRAALRRGDNLSPGHTSASPHHPSANVPTTMLQKAALVAVPLFHVTGSTSYSMMATLTGMKIVLMKKWIPEIAARLIREENVAVAGGVPSMVSDLIESSLVGHPLEGLLFGGAPAPDSLVPRARKAFPTATMIQGYGLTETNSIAVSASGEDYIMRPKSTGRASPVNEIRIVKNDVVVGTGKVGEVWLRGPNVMKEYWSDPGSATKATRKVITADGWLKTGDLGYLDEEDFLYIKDRIKDVIIRGGENIDSVSVENALYADPRVHEAAAVGVPDERLGELVTAVVSVKPPYRTSVTEATLITSVRNRWAFHLHTPCNSLAYGKIPLTFDFAHRLPRFAVPVMIVVHNEPFGAFSFFAFSSLTLSGWPAQPNYVGASVSTRMLISAYSLSYFRTYALRKDHKERASCNSEATLGIKKTEREIETREGTYGEPLEPRAEDQASGVNDKRRGAVGALDASNLIGDERNLNAKRDCCGETSLGVEMDMRTVVHLPTHPDTAKVRRIRMLGALLMTFELRAGAIYVAPHSGASSWAQHRRRSFKGGLGGIGILGEYLTSRLFNYGPNSDDTA